VRLVRGARREGIAQGAGSDRREREPRHRPNLGLLSGARIRRFVLDRVGARPIESLPVRFAAVATDLRTGELVILDRRRAGYRCAGLQQCAGADGAGGDVRAVRIASGAIDVRGPDIASGFRRPQKRRFAPPQLSATSES
jgi:predicted acylesterase/phospholipase RssA